MPSVRPVATSDSANGSADSEDHAGRARRTARDTAVRRCAVGSDPIHCAGPTRCGSSAGAREIRIVYAMNRATSTPASNSVMERLNGSVNEYAVASARNAISTECVRSSVIAVEPPLPLARRPVPGDEHDQLPADADQEAVGAGHVGQRERARRLVGLPGGDGTSRRARRRRGRPSARTPGRPRTRGAPR